MYIIMYAHVYICTYICIYTINKLQSKVYVWFMQNLIFKMISFDNFQGRESDRYGRKIVLIVMLAASALAYVIQGSATSLAVMLIARSLAGP